MRRVVVGTIVTFSLTVALIGFDAIWWSRLAVLVGAVVALAVAFRCRHPHPALQPALHDESGERHQARWHCHECGRSWPAAFERERAPVIKYAGFDQAKAPEAERRARVLEVRRRELALDRAGLRPTGLAPAVALHRRTERPGSGDPGQWRTPSRPPLELLHASSLDSSAEDEPSRSNG